MNNLSRIIIDSLMVLMLLGLLVLPVSSIGLIKIEHPQVAGTSTMRRFERNEKVLNRARLAAEKAEAQETTKSIKKPNLSKVEDK